MFGARTEGRQIMYAKVLLPAKCRFIAIFVIIWACGINVLKKQNKTTQLWFCASLDSENNSERE